MRERAQHAPHRDTELYGYVADAASEGVQLRDGPCMAMSSPRSFRSPASVSSSSHTLSWGRPAASCSTSRKSSRSSHRWAANRTIPRSGRRRPLHDLQPEQAQSRRGCPHLRRSCLRYGASSHKRRPDRVSGPVHSTAQRSDAPPHLLLSQGLFGSGARSAPSRPGRGHAGMMGGLAYMTVRRPGRPLRVGASIERRPWHLAVAVAVDCTRRERTGVGVLVKAGLFENNAFLVAQHMARFATTGMRRFQCRARIALAVSTCSRRATTSGLRGPSCMRSATPSVSASSPPRRLLPRTNCA